MYILQYLVLDFKNKLLETKHSVRISDCLLQGKALKSGKPQV